MLRISPDIIRRHFGARSICHCPEARIERLIHSTIQEVDGHGYNGPEVAMELYGVGTRYGDLLLLLKIDRSDDGWMAAARRTGHRVTSLPGAPRAKNALRDWAREEDRNEKELLDDLLPTAVTLALSRRSEPQRVRLAWDWVKDRYGLTASVAPISAWLSLDEFEQWLHKEIRNVLEAILLDEAYPKAARDPLDDAEPGRAGDWVRASQQDHMADAEDRVREREVLEKLPDVLSQRQEEVYSAWKENPDATSMELGTRLGMAPATVRVHKHRVREKAHDRLADM